MLILITIILVSVLYYTVNVKIKSSKKKVWYSLKSYRCPQYKGYLGIYNYKKKDISYIEKPIHKSSKQEYLHISVKNKDIETIL